MLNITEYKIPQKCIDKTPITAAKNIFLTVYLPDKILPEKIIAAKNPRI